MNYKFIWSKNKSSNTPSNGSSPNAPSGGSSPNAPSQSDTLSLVPFESFVGNVEFFNSPTSSCKSRFINSDKTEENEICRNIVLDQIFILSDELKQSRYVLFREGEYFDIKIETKQNEIITVNNLNTVNGVIGIDCSYEGNNIKMDNIALQDGIIDDKCDGKLKYTFIVNVLVDSVEVPCSFEFFFVDN